MGDNIKQIRCKSRKEKSCKKEDAAKVCSWDSVLAKCENINKKTVKAVKADAPKKKTTLKQDTPKPLKAKSTTAYTSLECQKWNESGKAKNPKTGRTISPSGNIYKALEASCKVHVLPKDEPSPTPKPMEGTINLGTDQENKARAGLQGYFKYQYGGLMSFRGRNWSDLVKDMKSKFKYAESMLDAITRNEYLGQKWELSDFLKKGSKKNYSWDKVYDGIIKPFESQGLTLFEAVMGPLVERKGNYNYTYEVTNDSNTDNDHLISKEDAKTIDYTLMFYPANNLVSFVDKKQTVHVKQGIAIDKALRESVAPLFGTSYTHDKNAIQLFAGFKDPYSFLQIVYDIIRNDLYVDIDASPYILTVPLQIPGKKNKIELVNILVVKPDHDT